MDRKIDQETARGLLIAMQKLKEHTLQLEENRQKRLWKKVDVPCSLHDALNRLSKAELDAIRKNYKFSNLSALKKKALADELARLIPLKYRDVLYLLDQSRCDFIKAIIAESGVISDLGPHASEAEEFTAWSMAFPGLVSEQKIYYLPNELIDIFSETNTEALENTVLRNTEWVGLTNGMLHFYGVMDEGLIIKKIKAFTGHNVDLLEFKRVFDFACDFYGQARYTPYGYQTLGVFDANKILEEQRMRPGVEYYPFTKEQLLKAGNPDAMVKTSAMKTFTRFLLKYYRLKDQDTDEITLQLNRLINMDSQPRVILQYLESWIEFPSMEFVEELMKSLSELINNTRQWRLKGHTPNELFKEEKKHMKPLPVEPFQSVQSSSNESSPPKPAKVGRNDPCPCGSGKKYKKCCGK